MPQTVLSLSDVRLSALDTSPIVSGSTPTTALHNTLDLARLADSLGYHRYWVAEHHSMRGVATAAPAVLIGQIAAKTERIRAGSGGVLLYNHAPIVIAEQFGTLEAFYPGRIDLGIGRSLGGSRRTALAVRSDQDRFAATFEQQLEELLSYFAPSSDQSIRAIPALGNTPPVWLLGSTDFSAKLAGALGLPYAFAHHLTPDAMSSALAVYRDSFQPSTTLPRPHVLVSVSVIAAESDGQAQWLAGPSKRKFLARHLGSPILLPTPEEAASYNYSEGERAAVDAKFANVFIGSAATVTEGLRSLADETGATELMVKTEVYDHGDRMRCYELLAGLWRGAGCRSATTTGS